MASMQFVPSNVDFSSKTEKFWQGQIGLVGYTDNIVFTKESLIQFLKSHDIAVDTNGTQLKKLPKYAQFGKLVEAKDGSHTLNEENASTQPQNSTVSNEQIEEAKAQAHRTNQAVTLPNGDVFRPTRKVREQPGGGSSQIQSLFGEDAEDEDENVNTTSAKPSGPPSTIKAVAQSTSEVEDISPPAQASQQQQSTFRPTRKVRELPGGGSSQISALFG